LALQAETLSPPPAGELPTVEEDEEFSKFRTMFSLFEGLRLRVICCASGLN
jgi:hypothetical protein